MQQLAESIMKNPSEIKILSNERIGYWDDKTQSVVVYNPNAADKGTFFRPRNGKNYFDIDLN
jgi:filamentous hemagglutinin